MNNTIPAAGDKVSFQHERDGYTVVGRVNNVIDGKVVIAVRRSRNSFGGGIYKVPVEKVTIEKRAGQVDPREHSEKGLETLAAMGTAPADWGLTEIKWVIKTIDREVWVACPTCEGQGAIYSIDGKAMTQKTLKAKFGDYSHESGWVAGGAKVTECMNCPYLKPRQSGYEMWAGLLEGRKETSFYGHYSRYNRGLVRAVRPVVTEVGIPQWHKDTRFDSRFHAAYGATTGHRECELCAKAIPSGRFVPVTGKGKDGTIHGAWIGEDCARKFFGIKNFKKEQVIERKEVA